MVINELEGRAPQRVIADVELTCEEEFVVEDGEGNVVHKLESQGPKARENMSFTLCSLLLPQPLLLFSTIAQDNTGFDVASRFRIYQRLKTCVFSDISRSRSTPCAPCVHHCLAVHTVFAFQVHYRSSRFTATIRGGRS